MCDLGESGLKVITAQCQDLEYLEISEGLLGKSLIEVVPLAHRLRILVLSGRCQVTLDTATRLLRICQNLSRAEFYAVYRVIGRAAEWPQELKNLRQLRMDRSSDSPDSVRALRLVSSFQKRRRQDSLK